MLCLPRRVSYSFLLSGRVLVSCRKPKNNEMESLNDAKHYENQKSIVKKTNTKFQIRF